MVPSNLEPSTLRSSDRKSGKESSLRRCFTRQFFVQRNVYESNALQVAEDMLRWNSSRNVARKLSSEAEVLQVYFCLQLASQRRCLASCTKDWFLQQHPNYGVCW